MEATTPVCESPLLTVEEAARYLRVGRTLFFALLKGGAIQRVKIGDLTRVQRSELDRYITNHGGK